MGAFAGIADVQGMDAYSGACAPTQLSVLKTLPLQYPYFYLRNARDNHVPLTFWGYSQLYEGNPKFLDADASDAIPPGGLTWDYQAHQNELVAQIAQVVLSGSKGMMTFQTEGAELRAFNTSLVAQTMRSIRTVSDIVRVGDIAAVGFTLSAGSTLNKEVMVETILAPPATDAAPGAPARLLVAVVNTDASGYSNLLCHVGVSKHWTFKKHTIDALALHLGTAPQLGAASNWREAIGGALVPLSDVGVAANGTDVVLSQIALDDQLVARWLVADVELIT